MRLSGIPGSWRLKLGKPFLNDAKHFSGSTSGNVSRVYGFDSLRQYLFGLGFLQNLLYEGGKSDLG
jgi:hypothetical protein